jgi:hypothetical protein
MHKLTLFERWASFRHEVSQQNTDSHGKDDPQRKKAI